MADASGYSGQVGYITIDEKEVAPGKTHRRSGLHVDGVYQASAGVWGGGVWGGGGYNKEDKIPQRTPAIDYHKKKIGGLDLHSIPTSEYGTGFLTVASHEGCKAWQQDFIGWPGPEGECRHIADQCREEAASVFKANSLYWVDPLCVHESLSMSTTVRRQFLRLSMPSHAPWFEGYTENPLGVLPTGPILPPRPEVYMMA